MLDFFLIAGLLTAAVTCIAAAVAERGAGERHAPLGAASYPVGRVEEVLEVTAIVNDAADRLVAVLRRSGADRLHSRQALRRLAHDALDEAAVDVARRAFRAPTREGSD